MTIEKLPSGSYRIKQMINGKRYSVTVDHKPSNAEATKLIAEKMNLKGYVSVDMPFEDACKAYIDAKSNVLSPSTIRGYRGVIRQISPYLMGTRTDAIKTQMIQLEVNRYSADHSPKSVANFNGFLMSVLNFYDIHIGKITLPQKEKKSPYIPTEEEVKRIFEYLKGSKYELCILLSGMGLRKSEICALQDGDLVGNVLTINKAKVQDENGNWIIKTTKTTESTRTIVVPDRIVELINEQGFYNGHPEMIYRALVNAQKELGIRHFPLHKMRHFFASYMHQYLTDKQVQEMGGWKTDRIMKTVYQHAMEMEEAKREASNRMGNLM